MTDTIIIRDLTIHTTIGVYDEERLQRQRLILNMELSTSLKQAGKTDALKDTIDYAMIIDEIKTMGNTCSFFLLEAFADHLVKHLLLTYPIEQVSLRVEKPDIITDVQSVGLSITRTKKDY